MPEVQDSGVARGTSVAGARWPVLLGAAAAIVVVVVVCLVAGVHPYHALSNSDPGAVVRFGASVLRIGVDLAAALCIGSLTFVVFCTRAQDSGLVSPGGYRALCDAARWAAVWLVLVVLLVPFDTADSTGQPLSRALTPRDFRALVTAAEEPKAWICTAVLLVVLVPCCRSITQWRPVIAVWGLALLALLPPLATGHSSSESSHDIATDAIMLHVPAAVIWLGLAAAFIRFRRTAGVPFAELTTRYQRVSSVCWWIVAVSGIADALVLTKPGQWFSTGYGLLVVGSVVVMALLYWMGSGLRLWVARSVGARERRAVARVVAVEVIVLGLLAGVSAALSRLAPPAFLDYRSSISQQLLGYDLAGSATPGTLLTDWRIDLIFGPLTAGLVVAYVVAVRRIRRAGQAWPAARTVCWLAGCAVLLLASNAGIGRYAPAMFSIHMLRHMLIGMVVPILLALGGPLTLAARAWPARQDRTLLGASGWCALIRDAPLVRFLLHPMVALVLFAISPFVLYDTSLFDQAVRFHWAHQAIDLYFLLIGYLFAWVTVGVDPTPHRLPSLARVGLLLAAMPADVVFAAVIMNSHRIIGNGSAGFNFYQALALPWVSNLAADQRAAGYIALVVGEIALLGALAALLPRWAPTVESDEGTQLLARHRDGTGLAADRT